MKRRSASGKTGRTLSAAAFSRRRAARSSFVLPVRLSLTLSPRLFFSSLRCCCCCCWGTPPGAYARGSRGCSCWRWAVVADDGRSADVCPSRSVSGMLWINSGSSNGWTQIDRGGLAAVLT